MRFVLLIVLVVALSVPVAHAGSAAKKFKNCTALNKVYPHGVGRPGAHDKTASGNPVTNFKRSRALYLANKSRDRDGDGIACEKH